MLTAASQEEKVTLGARLRGVLETFKHAMDDTEDIQDRIERLGRSMVLGGTLRFLTSIVVMALLIVRQGSYAHFVRELVAVLIGVTTCWFGVFGGLKKLEYPTRLFFVTELFMMTVLSTFLFYVVDSEETTTNLCNPEAGNYVDSSGNPIPVINFATKPIPTLSCGALSTPQACPNETATADRVVSTTNDDCDFELRISRAKVAVAVFDLVMALFNVMWAMDFNDALNDKAVNDKIDDRIKKSHAGGDDFVMKAMQRMPSGLRAPLMSAFSDKGLTHRYYKLWEELVEPRKDSRVRAAAREPTTT